MTTRRIVVCLGTRPEAIKLAPVVKALREAPGLEVRTISTGQHRAMLDQVTDALDLDVDVDLALMREDQSPLSFMARALDALGAALADEGADAVLVQGDTATTLCGALAAFHHKVPVGHVEAGLRSGDLARPFPEEANRSMISRIARWHFCATPDNASNLLAEGIDPLALEITGNTVIDALLMTADRPLEPAAARIVPPRGARFRILVTMHRRETQGATQLALCEAIARIAERDDVDVVLPVHLSPAVRASVNAMLADRERVHLLEPLDYHTFVHALRDADIALTDSGGVQEEAPSFDVPVLVMRDTTERPEGVEAGCARLCGTSPNAVIDIVEELLEDPLAYDAMARAANPYGDGQASARIVERLSRDLLDGILLSAASPMFMSWAVL